MARQKHPKRANGSFLSLPHHLIRHPNFGDLSGNAVKLLIELIKEHNGFNMEIFQLPLVNLKIGAGNPKEHYLEL